MYGLCKVHKAITDVCPLFRPVHSAIVSKFPINSNLPFNNDSNDDKQSNTLKNARIKQPKKVCLSHININSTRNKLDSLFEFTYLLTIADFLAVSETKIDSSFPTGRFNLPGFKTPFRKD